MNDNVFVRMNGIGHAFSRELGCTCKRCREVKFHMANPPEILTPFDGWDDPPWRSHTSSSILAPNQDGTVKQHILIDVGAGVVDSLVCSGLEGLDHVCAILLTHWHPDHALGLNQLCESVKRSAKRQGQEFQKIPLYCTLETYDHLRTKGGQSYVLEHRLCFQEILPEQPFEVGGDPLVRFTPIPVAHGGIKGSVIYIAEIGPKKAVFAWDIDVPSKKLPYSDVTNLEVINRNIGSFKDADVLFIAANTWNADETEAGGEKKTGHTSYQRAKSYIEAIKAQKVYLVHMSGHEDGAGEVGFGWKDEQWETAVRGDGIAVSRQGMVIEL
ncbi:MAG: MBL fold metallo-hydrolase [Anaerohalosphaera sp.]|nr:MBL fold metallo-hydrolase [Anaerohalosphaera sp.]